VHFFEELIDPMACRLAEARGRKVIDIEAITLIRRDTACGGMGLGDESIRLEARKVVANRRRGDIEATPSKNGLGAHRFTGADVFLDEGLQNLGSAVVEHVGKLAIVDGD
jgi:hypothetical protein